MDWAGCCGGRQPADNNRGQANTGQGWFDGLFGSSEQKGQVLAQNPGQFQESSDLEAVKADHIGQQLVGVGIVFDAGDNGRGPNDEGLRVSGLTPKGSAEASHKIRMHDKLAMVDGNDVRAWNAKDISPIILGPPGTTVTLGFFSEKTGEYYTVALYRKQLHQVI